MFQNYKTSEFLFAYNLNIKKLNSLFLLQIKMQMGKSKPLAIYIRKRKTKTTILFVQKCLKQLQWLLIKETTTLSVHTRYVSLLLWWFALYNIEDLNKGQNLILSFYFYIRLFSFPVSYYVRLHLLAFTFWFCKRDS